MTGEGERGDVERGETSDRRAGDARERSDTGDGGPGPEGPARRSRNGRTATGGSRERVDERSENDGRSAPLDGDPRPAAPAPSSFDAGPSRVGWALTAGFGLLAALPVAITGPPGLLAGAGLVGLVAGLARESEGLVGLGGAAQLAGALAGGAYGLGPEATLAATAGALLAYDAADNALSVGAQLGAAAPTADLELVHAAGSTVLLATGGAAAYAVFRLVGGGQPELALLLLVVGAVALSAALR